MSRVRIGREFMNPTDAEMCACYIGEDEFLGAQKADQFCGAKNDQTHVCTMKKGHTSKIHHSHDTYNRIYSAWGPAIHTMGTDRIERLRKYLLDGLSAKEAARKAKVHRSTAYYLRDSLFISQGEIECGCGKPSNHYGYCKARMRRNGVYEAHVARCRSTEHRRRAFNFGRSRHTGGKCAITNEEITKLLNQGSTRYEAAKVLGVSWHMVNERIKLMHQVERKNKAGE